MCRSVSPVAEPGRVSSLSARPSTPHMLDGRIRPSFARADRPSRRVRRDSEGGLQTGEQRQLPAAERRLWCLQVQIHACWECLCWLVCFAHRLVAGCTATARAPSA